MSAITAFTAFTSPAGIRQVLWLDAITGTGAALLSLAAPGLVASTLGAPLVLVQESAWVLLAFVGFIAWLLRQRPLPLAGVRLLGWGNALWALASVGLALVNGVGLNALGVAYVLAQAALVGVLALLQLRAARRSGLLT